MNNIVAIGGLGGSGTRVLAEILRSIGFFIGNDLNKELDNLLFTRLFKNTDWYSTATTPNILERLAWFRAIQEGHQELPTDTILEAIHSNETFESSGYKLDFSSYAPSGSWAWKEPNSHIYLKHLARAYKNLKYILVIRNGLDMAHSSNKQQLHNWGKLLYDIDWDSKDIESIALAQLRYWIEANAAAITAGRLYLRDNFMVCNLDQLCADPQFQIRRILKFLDRKVEASLFNELVELPVRPSSSGRYQRNPLNLPTDMLLKVHKLNAGQPL